ncbi:hypothetical protein K432DRAFT_297746, partial [Lepidopterella palustris CBS 459.81]
YEALSYCGEDVSEKLPLRCDNGKLSVTRNLHSALQHLRFRLENICQHRIEPPHTRTLWTF